MGRSSLNFSVLSMKEAKGDSSSKDSVAVYKGLTVTVHNVDDSSSKEDSVAVYKGLTVTVYNVDDSSSKDSVAVYKGLTVTVYNVDDSSSKEDSVAVYKGLTVTVHNVDKAELALNRRDLVDLVNVCFHVPLSLAVVVYAPFLSACMDGERFNVPVDTK